MNEHDHTVKDGRVTEPTHDEVAKKAYAIYEKEGHSQGHAENNWLEAEAQLKKAGSPGGRCSNLRLDMRKGASDRLLPRSTT